MMRRPFSIIAVLVTLAAVSARSGAQEADPNNLSKAEGENIAFRQVQMHVWISETTEQGLRDIGANLQYRRFADNGDDVVQQINTNVFDPFNPNFAVTLPAPSQSIFPPPLRPDNSGNLDDGVQTQSGAGLTFSLIADNHGQLNGVFRAVEQNNDVDLISKPELLVIEGQMASIQAGGKIPYQDLEYNNKAVPQLKVTFEDVGVNMNIKPTVREDNLIQLQIQKLEVNDVARIDNIRGVELPVFATRSQTGEVLVPNGQALVIGGLSSSVTRRTERRVPFLGKIPLIGIPFRGRRSEVQNVQLLIFVAPTVVDLREMSPSAKNALDFWRNGSWQNEDTIQTEIDLLQSER
jgi:type II secretory pathway component GspD/PulD (secretin)